MDVQGLGHIGAALLAVLPLGVGLHAAGEPRLALVGVVIAVGVSSVPDFDQQLPIEHRGPTHTVWFVALGGLTAGCLGWLFGAIPAGAVAGTATVLSLCSHLAADSITPMGIRPYRPLSGREYCFDLVYAANRRANWLVFTVGVGTALLAQTLVFVVG